MSGGPASPPVLCFQMVLLASVMPLSGVFVLESAEGVRVRGPPGVPGTLSDGEHAAGAHTWPSLPGLLKILLLAIHKIQGQPWSLGLINPSRVSPSVREGNGFGCVVSFVFFFNLKNF